MNHLWEVDHPYYASSQYEEKYESWEDFIDEWGNAEEDYNLVYRIDWCEGKGHELPEYNGDDSIRFAEVRVGILFQRKGFTSVQIVKVCRNDEPKIIEFMKKKFSYIKEMWEPVS